MSGPEQRRRFQVKRASGRARAAVSSANDELQSPELSKEDAEWSNNDVVLLY